MFLLTELFCTFALAEGWELLFVLIGKKFILIIPLPSVAFVPIPVSAYPRHGRISTFKIVA
jgi:hypothetical protein